MEAPRRPNLPPLGPQDYPHVEDTLDDDRLLLARYAEERTRPTDADRWDRA